MSQLTTTTYKNKIATLTAIAACMMMIGAPASAAENDGTNASAPSAIDSSKRVIRLAQPTTANNSTNATVNVNTAPLSPQNSINQLPRAAAIPVPAEIAGTTRVFERTPTSATGVDLRSGQLSNIPTPQVQLSDISFVKTVLIPQQISGIDKLDVSLLDDFIEDVSPNARHYPPNFPNRSQRHYTREKIKVLADWIEPYASKPDASYDVLIRAAKLNGMGRNLDLGTDYAIRGGRYVDRAIKVNPESGEANFLYGMMLSEGGGFKEGQKYLDRAVALNYTEAEQSLAQSDLLSDRRSQALDRLRRLEQKMPNDPIIPQQIKLVEEGKFYIWDIPAPDINVKPAS
ncbi:tetratricopeptide repeat protein [Psychrobacter sp. T6-1]|uniref:tetratricopeptide repeat protein n=1 Tax=Psychrobacter sp. T6-1 TaxID=3457447 RepID=UPI003FD2030A